MAHREELGTLKEQSKEGPMMEKLLNEHEAAFQKVKGAILSGELKPGVPSKDVAKKYGKPIDEDAPNGGQKWLYRSKTGKWLDRPWITLYFDAGGKLEKWDCGHTECPG
ncbi:MAG: hypothetical protein ACREH5_02710 [Candidatus Omnitrophota bacterium]